MPALMHTQRGQGGSEMHVGLTVKRCRERGDGGVPQVRSQTPKCEQRPGGDKEVTGLVSGVKAVSITSARGKFQVRGQRA